VLTDIQMPEMDGFMVAECIRATEAGWKDAVSSKNKFG
jgi:CheY-like chemotaxis protein